MMWQQLNSAEQYKSLQGYCLTQPKTDDLFWIDSTKGRITKFFVFQCWAMIQRIKGAEVSNPFIISTFNSEQHGVKGTPETKTLELIWSYGKTLLSGLAEIQPALAAQPSIESREMATYRELGNNLRKARINTADLTRAVIAYQPQVMRQCEEIYQSWVRWQADTFAQEALTLIANPDDTAALAALRKRQKDRLDGAGLFKIGVSTGGKFQLYPKAKDGLPLLVLSPEADTDFSADVKAKVDMFKSSGTGSAYFYGRWTQSGNRKSITLLCSSNFPSAVLVQTALETIGVTRAFSMEAIKRG